MKLLPFALLIFVVLGCERVRRDEESKPPTAPAPANSGRMVANMNGPPKSRFLGEASAYIGNLFMADEALAKEMAKADAGTMSLDRFLVLLKDAAKTEKDDFGNIEVTPPAAYKPLLTKLIKIHNSHGAAYLEYAKAMAEPKQGRKHVDKADALLKQGLYNLDDARKFITAAMREFGG